MNGSGPFEAYPRRAREIDWTTTNPVLLVSEPGIAVDVRGVKSGDGVTPWNDLPWVIEPGGNIDWLIPLRIRIGPRARA